MREILFRGKRTENGEWIYGNLIEDKWGDDNGNTIYAILQDRVAPDIAELWTPVRVTPETVGEYTGLTDKNGKKVFEGDIIKDKKLPRIYMIGYNEDLMKYAFLYYHKELKNIYCGGFVSKKDGKSIEIIGNIHDNPELLEDEQ